MASLDYLAAGRETTALNVGTGVGSSVLDVLRATEAVAGRPVPHEFADRRLGDPAATFADPATAEAALGWRAGHGLDKIVDTAYRWHTDNAG